MNSTERSGVTVSSVSEELHIHEILGYRCELWHCVWTAVLRCACNNGPICLMGIVSSCWSDDCQPASLHATPMIVSSVGLFKLHTRRTSHSQDTCTSMEFNRWVLDYSLRINTCTCAWWVWSPVIDGCGLQLLVQWLPAYQTYTYGSCHKSNQSHFTFTRYWYIGWKWVSLGLWPVILRDVCANDQCVHAYTWSSGSIPCIA